MGSGVLLFISGCISKPKTERVNFYIQYVLRWHSKSDLRVTSSWDHCYDLFIAIRELSKYLILTLLDSVVTRMS